jgi:hypothetical protein
MSHGVDTDIDFVVINKYLGLSFRVYLHVATVSLFYPFSLASGPAIPQFISMNLYLYEMKELH